MAKAGITAALKRQLKQTAMNYFELQEALVSCLNSFRIRFLQQDFNELANQVLLKTDTR